MGVRRCKEGSVHATAGRRLLRKGEFLRIAFGVSRC